MKSHKFSGLFQNIEIWILDLCFDSYYPLINQEASEYDA